MSQFNSTTREKPARRERLGTIVAAAVILPILAMLFLTFISARGRHISTMGQVLEARIVKAGTGESLQGGYVLYQIEARVRYSLGGKIVSGGCLPQVFQGRRNNCNCS